MMENATAKPKDIKQIRFIDSQYKTLFTIPDGGSITVTQSNGEKTTRKCKYLGECHTEIGGTCFHICEFAERMEQNGNTYAPCEVKPKSKDYER